MKIEVRVKPRSSQEKVVQLAPDQFEVWVKCPAVEGKANAAVVKILATYFNVAKSCVEIFRGQVSRRKFIQIIGQR